MKTMLVELKSAGRAAQLLLAESAGQARRRAGDADSGLVQADEDRLVRPVCAELCGWGHYKMKGRLTVESEADYQAWLDRMTTEQNATQRPPQRNRNRKERRNEHHHGRLSRP